MTAGPRPPGRTDLDHDATTVAGQAGGLAGPQPIAQRPRVVLDCRWLGRGGPGRVTELALRDLEEINPPWDRILVGSSPILRQAPFRSSTLVACDVDPKSLFGQKSRSLPRGDVTVYFHQIRPIVAGPSVTIIHDTIPLRHGSTRLARLSKRQFMRLVAACSDEIITVSPYSRDCLVRDIGIDARRVTIADLPIGGERFDAIFRARTSRQPDDLLLFVGRFAAHKNLERLVLAFGRSGFAARGGELHLFGGTPSECAVMRTFIARAAVARASVHGPCTEAELDAWLTRALVVAMPSLEEGFGLPAFEAAAAGIRVVTSKAGAMGQLPEEVASFCDPRSVSSIASAIDSAVSAPADAPPYRRAGNLGTVIVEAVETILGRSSTTL